MSRHRIAALILFILLICCSSAFAHPGRTDYQGGHYNRSTGEYHFHHGESAHQHPDGICPFETSAKATAKPSTGSSQSSAVKTSSSVNAVSQTSKKEMSIMFAEPLLILALVAIFMLMIMYYFAAQGKIKAQKALHETEIKLAEASIERDRLKSELSGACQELEKQTASVTRLSHILQGKETIIDMTRKQSDAYLNSVIELEDELRKTRSQLKETSSAHEELVSIWEDHLLSNDPFRNLHYEARVYVRREGASKYHTTIHCGTHSNYKLIPLRNAMEKGYSPCLQCFTSMPKEHIVSQYKTNK